MTAGGALDDLRLGRELLARSRDASREWSRAIVSSVLAAAHGGPSTGRGAQRRRAEAVAGGFGEAASAFRRAGAAAPSREAALGLADALEGQAATYTAMGPGTEVQAVASLAGAVAALDGVPGQGSGSDPDVLGRKVRLLRSAGEVWARIGAWDEAADRFAVAAEAVDALIDLAPDDPEARLEKATLLAAWAALGVRRGSPAWSPRLPADPEASLERHRASLAAFDEALDRLAEPGIAAVWKSGELCRLGDLQRALSRRRAALESYRAAVRLYDEVVDADPRHRSARGLALERLAAVAREVERPAEALWALERGIADLESAERPGGYDDLARGTMLVHLGELYLAAARLDEARGCLRRGLEVLIASTAITDDDKLPRDRLIHRGRALLHG